VLIDYTDTTGKRRSLEKNVSIQFRTDTATASGSRAGTQTSFFSSWTFYIIVIAALGIGYYYRKKIAAVLRKSKK